MWCVILFTAGRYRSIWGEKGDCFFLLFSRGLGRRGGNQTLKACSSSFWNNNPLFEKDTCSFSLFHLTSDWGVFCLRNKTLSRFFPLSTSPCCCPPQAYRCGWKLLFKNKPTSPRFLGIFYFFPYLWNGLCSDLVRFSNNTHKESTFYWEQGSQRCSSFDTSQLLWMTWKSKYPIMMIMLPKAGKAPSF